MRDGRSAALLTRVTSNPKVVCDTTDREALPLQGVHTYNPMDRVPWLEALALTPNQGYPAASGRLGSLDSCRSRIVAVAV